MIICRRRTRHTARRVALAWGLLALAAVLMLVASPSRHLHGIWGVAAAIRAARDAAVVRKFGLQKCNSGRSIQRCLTAAISQMSCVQPAGMPSDVVLLHVVNLEHTSIRSCYSPPQQAGWRGLPPPKLQPQRSWGGAGGSSVSASVASCLYPLGGGDTRAGRGDFPVAAERRHACIQAIARYLVSDLSGTVGTDVLQHMSRLHRITSGVATSVFSSCAAAAAQHRGTESSCERASLG
jgi:hypothetical protein